VRFLHYLLALALAAVSGTASAQKAERPGVDSFRVGDQWTFLVTLPQFSMTETVVITAKSGNELTFGRGGERWPSRDNPYPDAKTPWRAFPLQVAARPGIAQP